MFERGVKYSMCRVIIPQWRSLCGMSLFSIEIDRGKTYKKKVLRSEITSNKKEITGKSPQRFLGKYAGRNLISARPLYPFDDAIGQTITLPPSRIPSRLVLKIEDLEAGEQENRFCQESLLKFLSANLLSLAPSVRASPWLSKRLFITAPLNSVRLNQSLASREVTNDLAVKLLASFWRS